MRVTLCVDALEPQLGGIGRYTWELCKGLARRPELVSLAFLGRGRLIDDPASLLSDRLQPSRGRLGRAMDRWKTDRALGTTIVHGPNYFLPSKAHSGVVTIHDLSVFRFPETHPAARIRAFEKEFATSLDQARQIITDTETVRAELIDYFSVSPDRITAVPLGVDSIFRPVEADRLKLALKAWGLVPGSYGLSVSALEPRKRIAELLAAWRRLPQDLRTRFPLVLAGGSGWQNESLRDLVETGVAEGWLRHLGFVKEDLLPTLYAGAAVFVYPSMYEGFGLPPLEAMASGVPVVVSNRSCLPEVCGNAPMYIDPDDPEAFTDSLERALTDSDWRSGAVSAGLDRARSYTWDRCIEATLSVYRGMSSTNG